MGSREPLVPLGPIRSIDAYERLKILGARDLVVRRDVLRRLIAADRGLPSGFRLLVLDAWRSVEEQQRLVDHYSAIGDTAGWVADTSKASFRAPHTTGGAVDLTLMFNGIGLSLGSQFDEFADVAHLRSLEESPGPERELRRILGRVMLDAGFAPYRLEWWHWSYGDDVWAARAGEPAIYDICSAVADDTGEGPSVGCSSPIR